MARKWVIRSIVCLKYSLIWMLSTTLVPCEHDVEGGALLRL